MMEIRCCCDAGKLLGTVDCTYQLNGDRSFVRFALTNGMELELPLGLYNPGEGGGYKRPALKSNHHPIETLRLIPSFKEAT
jgi:hypothetical protein